MRKIFRKAMTILGSAALIGMTVGAASAASYPTPFTSNTVIVVGANAAPSDNIAASNIASSLDSAATIIATGTTTGESKSLASGSDLLYLNDELNENVAILTKDDLPTVLADGTFTNDDGINYNFEQILVVGGDSSNHFDFTNSDNDLDDPVLAIELSDIAKNNIYTLTATFNKVVNFTDSLSKGQEITLFGKTYNIGQSTDEDTLVLMGGAANVIVNVGDTKIITVNDVDYTITLNGLSSGTTMASITINGETKTFKQGQSKFVSGIDVYTKTIFRTGSDDTGYAELQLGIGKLTLETGSAVMIGKNADDIEGTLVTLTGTTDDIVGSLTKIQIEVAAEDNDVNHLQVGESFIDPVFKTILVNFNGVENGPIFSGEKDIGRTELEIQKGGNRELQLVLTDNSGNSATLPFTYETELSDDNGKIIHIVEGESIADEEYFILNSRNNQHFMKMTKINIASTATNSDVIMKDLLSGVTYTFNNHDFSNGYDATILGQTYKITNDSSDTVTIVSSDFSSKISVYPYIELVSNQDTRMAYTDDVLVFNDAIHGDGKTVVLPTGEVEVTFDDTPTNDCNINFAVVSGSEYLINSATDVEAIIKVGSVDYIVNAIDSISTDEKCTNVDVSFALDDDQSINEIVQETDPAILFVEDDDKSGTIATTKNAILISVHNDNNYDSVRSPIFTGEYATETWDDTDFEGWLTNYGTYVWRDSRSSYQNFVGLSYGDDMMYAEVSISEGESITSSEVGVMTIIDTNINSADGKNLIVVGGSAINSVAAELLGAAYSEAAFTSATGVAAGEFLIQSFSRAGKTALLVAGYNAIDTEKATEYLLNNDVSTSIGKKYKGTSSTNANLVNA